jgi:hypothetical protein
MTHLESEKIDRLENHFQVYKTDMVDVKTSVNNIEIALIGSSLNGNKGMVHLLDDIKTRVKDLEEKQILADELASNIKWFQRGVLGILFAYLTYLITK